MGRDLVRLLRPRHWIKNVPFIFAPLIFSLSLFDVPLLLRSLLCFAAFCCAASFSYILNDVMDRDKDRRHPKKKKRPIASGRVPVGAGVALAAACLAVSLGLCLFLGVEVLVIIAAYVALNILYSLRLKNLVIIDVLCIALGFILRVMAGSYAIGVMLTNWILLATLFISLFLGFGKRRNELYEGHDGRQRTVLTDYTPQLLDYLIVISVGLTIITYSLYAVDPETSQHLKTDKLILTIPFVLYGLFKYLYLVYRKKEGSDPAELVSRDRGIILTVGLYAVSVVALIYMGHAKIF